jgi:hypothetical protein
MQFRTVSGLSFFVGLAWATYWHRGTSQSNRTARRDQSHNSAQCSRSKVDASGQNALTNRIVKAAIEALEKGDRNTWSALFEPDAERYDDGSPRSLRELTRNALGHEQFTSIDRVENNGLDLTGAFHSDEWGDFRTYFRFQLSPAAKIKRLDIGQAT